MPDLIIRKAEKKDIPEWIELIKQFEKDQFNEYHKIITDENYARQIVETFLDTTLIAEKDNRIIGFITGRILNAPISNEKIFQEYLWLVAPKYRKNGIALELLKAMEKKAKEEWGCKLFILGFLGNRRPITFMHLYEHLGYKFLEAHYIKEL